MKVQDLSPDLILLNGRIFTLDAEGTVAQAVAVKDGRIVAVGGDAEIRAMAGPNTRCTALGGRAVIPGIFDSHNHLMEVVRQRAKDTPPGERSI